MDRLNFIPEKVVEVLNSILEEYIFLNLLLSQSHSTAVSVMKAPKKPMKLVNDKSIYGNLPPVVISLINAPHSVEHVSNVVHDGRNFLF
jgi:hypothetical protein